MICSVIELQKPVRTATKGVPAGTPFNFFREMPSSHREKLEYFILNNRILKKICESGVRVSAKGILKRRISATNFS